MTNYHSIFITYFWPTNTKWSRVKITSKRFWQSVTLNRDYSMDYEKQVTDYLINKWFDILWSCDNWSIIITSTFKEIR